MLIHFSHNTFTIKWHLTDRIDNYRLQFQADHCPPLLAKNHTDIDFKKLWSFSYFTPNFILGYGFVPIDFFFQHKQSLKYQWFIGVQDVLTLPPLIYR